MFAALFAILLAAEVSGPNAGEILKQAFDNEAAQKSVRAHYFYRERAERRAAPRNGKPGKLTFTRTYEWVYLEGEPFRKLVAMNDKPLKGNAAQREEQRMRMTAMERRAAAGVRNPRSHIIHLGDFEWDVVWRVMEHRLLPDAVLEGRKVWVIASAPKREFDAATPEEQRALCYRYTFWVDQQDVALAAYEYEVIREGVEGMPGSRTRTSLVRITKGLWFPKSQEGSYIASPPRPLSKWVQKHSFFDYRKFDAASTVIFDDLKP